MRAVRERVMEEIRRAVAASIEGKDCLPAGRLAISILKAHPGCGWTVEEIAEEILRAAVAAGVAVEIGTPEPTAG